MKRNVNVNFGVNSTVEFRTFCRLGGSLSSGKSLFSLNRISATWVQSRPKGRNSTVVCFRPRVGADCAGSELAAGGRRAAGVSAARGVQRPALYHQDPRTVARDAA